MLILTALVCSAAAGSNGNLSGDQFVAARGLLNTSVIELSVLKGSLSSHAGRTVELTGTVNGLAKSEDSISFIFDCGGETLLIRTPLDHPECIRLGSTIRALVRIGSGSVGGLTDLHLEAAAYDYEVASAEKRLAERAQQAQVEKPVPPKPTSEPQAFRETRKARQMGLSSRAMQIYDPYRRAISQFNPRLTPEQLDAITKSILAFSEHYGVDPRLVVAMILVESNFRPTATSPKGAMGLGQLMPGTAKGLGVSNAYDPVQNIEASVRLIRQHLDSYGDLALALSAYNAGPGAVRKHGGVPPFRETQNYIRKVVAIYQELCGS